VQRPQGAQLGTHEVAVLIGGIQYLSEPLPLTKCLVTFLHAVPQEPVRVVSELESPACMITQHSDIHLPRLTDSMVLQKTAALRVSS
jgi:hypothetical protein